MNSSTIFSSIFIQDKRSLAYHPKILQGVHITIPSKQGVHYFALDNEAVEALFFRKEDRSKYRSLATKYLQTQSMLQQANHMWWMSILQ